MADHPELQTGTKASEAFISYASPDFDRAAALHARLVAAGFSVWFDKARLDPGCDWHKEIEAGCEAARVILPLLTPYWQNSEWTKYETYSSDGVIPLVAEGKPETVMTPPLRRWNAIALDPLTAGDAAWETLFAAIRGKLAEPVLARAPRVLDLPYPANPFFIGRDADLVSIHEELHEAPVAALTQRRVRALAAMGGVGKTTLANEYARRFWRLYPQILWVDARSGLESGYALLFDRLFPDRAADDLRQPDKARLALVELSTTRERLLVLDNVEDSASARPFLPRTGTGCRTLITSRFADWPGAEGIRTIVLDVLEPEPAREFLITRTGRVAEGHELVACEALAKVLGYLPLALEQAGAYIAAPGSGVNFAEYLRLHEAAAAELLAKGALGSTEYPDSVITTWRMTVAKLSPEARAVQRLCAWYADTPIPRALIMTAGAIIFVLAMRFGPVTQPDSPIQEELRLRSALMGLAQYSMILNANDSTFRFHGLVQTVERLRAKADDVDALEFALDCMVAYFPCEPSDPTNRQLCRMLLPHILTLDSRFVSDCFATTRSTLLDRTGAFLRDSDDAARAVPLLHCVVEIRERVLGEDHPDTLTSLNSLALCLHKIGRAAEALPIFRRILESRDRIFGAEHPETFKSLDNLAGCMRALDDRSGALPFHRQALQSSERVLGAEHPDTLTSLNNLAMCLRELGDAAGALPLFQRALSSSERVLGAEHPDTLISLNNLASCLRALGNAAEALPYFSRALATSERVLGAEDSATLPCLNNLALCLRSLGQVDEAFPLHRRALEIIERKYGADQFETLAYMSNMGSCLMKLGDANAALPLFVRLVKGCEHFYGDGHSQTFRSLDNLAICMAALGDVQGALRLRRQAVERSERLLGAGHRDTLISVHILANYLTELGDSVAALPFHRRAAELSIQLFGFAHPMTQDLRRNFRIATRAATKPPGWPA